MSENNNQRKPPSWFYHWITPILLSVISFLVGLILVIGQIAIGNQLEDTAVNIENTRIAVADLEKRVNTIEVLPQLNAQRLSALEQATTANGEKLDRLLEQVAELRGAKRK